MYLISTHATAFPSRSGQPYCRRATVSSASLPLLACREASCPLHPLLALQRSLLRICCVCAPLDRNAISGKAPSRVDPEGGSATVQPGIGSFLCFLRTTAAHNHISLQLLRKMFQDVALSVRWPSATTPDTSGTSTATPALGHGCHNSHHATQARKHQLLPVACGFIDRALVSGFALPLAAVRFARSVLLRMRLQAWRTPRRCRLHFI